jgi:hypothetical protein
MVVGTEAGMAVAITAVAITAVVITAVVIMEAAILVVMASDMRMVAGIMAGPASQRAPDIVARTSARSAMRPSVLRIFETPSTCIPAPSATAV